MVGAALFLGTCAMPEKDTPRTGQAETNQTATPEASAPHATAPAPPPASTPSPGPTPPPPEEPPDLAARIPSHLKDPGRLRGLGPGDLTAMLGAPDFRRRDAPADLWQYRQKRCVLDLFLYPNKKTGRTRVTHFAARGLGAADVGAEECLLDLLIERYPGRAG